MNWIVIMLLWSTNVGEKSIYQDFFGDDYEKASNLIASNEGKFKFLSNQFNLSDTLLKSIVYPEAIRYNGIKDMVETLALETIYVRLGEEYANFSIGQFQMKPSFAEEIENRIFENKILNKKYYKVFRYSVENEKEIRGNRIERLKSIDWQIKYVCAFVDVVNQYFEINNLSKLERVAFYASAYNLGIKHPPEKIKKWTTVKAFPYGEKYEGKQFSYSELAVHYYHRMKNI